MRAPEVIIVFLVCLAILPSVPSANSTSGTGLTCISPFVNTCPPIQPIFLGSQGGNLTVSVLAQNVSGFNSFSVVIGANASILQPIIVSAAGGLLQNVNVMVCTNGMDNPCKYWLGLSPGDIRVYGYGSVTNQTTGILFTVTYKILASTNGTPITLFDQVSPSGWSCACALYSNSIANTSFQTGVQGAQVMTFEPLVADVNNDCSVGFDDLFVILTAYGSSPGLPNWNSRADLDGNGVVDFVDVAIWAESFGSNC